MTTKMVYELEIYVKENGEITKVDNFRMEEEPYKTLLNSLETRKFITVMNCEQNPITINVEDVHKIITTISLQVIEYINTTTWR